MDLSTAIWYVAGIFALLALLQLLAQPLELVFRALGNSIIGGLALVVMNLVGAYVGFHVGLNPISAAIVGLLGVPGFVALGAMRMILG